MDALTTHQTRLLIASLRRECRKTAQHLERIQESGHGDAHQAVLFHCAGMAVTIVQIRTQISRLRKGSK